MKKIINILNKGKGVLTIAPEDLQVIKEPVALPEFPETIVGRKLLILDQDDNIILESSADAIPQTRSYTGVDGQANGTAYTNGTPINITVPALPSGAVLTGTEVFITYTANGDSYKSELRTRITPPNSAVISDVVTSTSDTGGTLTNASLATFTSENPVGDWLFEFLDTFNDTGIDQTISEIKIVVSFTAPVALFVNGSVVADNIFPPTTPEPQKRKHTYMFAVTANTNLGASTSWYTPRHQVANTIFNTLWIDGAYNGTTEAVVGTALLAFPVTFKQKVTKITYSIRLIGAPHLFRVISFKPNPTGTSIVAIDNKTIHTQSLVNTNGIRQPHITAVPATEQILDIGDEITLALFNNNVATTLKDCFVSIDVEEVI
jgi:hypothetical protein